MDRPLHENRLCRPNALPQPTRRDDLNSLCVTKEETHPAIANLWIRIGALAAEEAGIGGAGLRCVNLRSSVAQLYVGW